MATSVGASSSQSNLNLRTIILPMIAIVVRIAYFSIVNPLFLSSSNALNIGRQSAVLLTVAVGITRVYLGVHWPTDVAAGWVVGAAWALASSAIMQWLQRRGEVEPPEGTP